MALASGNHFLDSLAPADQAVLRPHLREAALRAGAVLIEQEAPVTVAVFPVDAQLANVIYLGDGASIEVSMVGHEGLAGLAPIMTNKPCGWQVAVRAPGRAWTAPAPLIRELQASSASFLGRLLDLTQFYQDQAAQIAACNGAHRMQARLARWLLMALDLAPGDTVQVTQEHLAALLGGQRTTVNEAAQNLKALGAIRYGRGRIRVLDRTRLAAAACSCYEAIRQRGEDLGIRMRVAFP